jgi:acetyl esterase/lipase
MQIMKRLHAVVLAMAALLTATGAQAAMTVDEFAALPPAPPGMVIPYGKETLQFGELTLPEGKGPHPVMVWIHGGCWLAKWDIAHSRMTARAFADAGFAVWNLEYRRVGNPGGGWPGTFLDVAAGADRLREIAKQQPLDLSRVIAGGHSAGGYFALWLAARPKIASASKLYSKAPLRVSGVLAVAPAPQLAALHVAGTCNHVIDRLMGGDPRALPDRYAAVLPAGMVPLGVPQTVVLGKHDADWRPVGSDYIEAARAAGETQITEIEAPDAGHFEVVVPGSGSWPLVIDAARALQDQLAM